MDECREGGREGCRKGGRPAYVGREGLAPMAYYYSARVGVLSRPLYPYAAALGGEVALGLGLSVAMHVTVRWRLYLIVVIL